MISIGTSPEDAAKSIALSTRFSHVFSSVGIHPHLAGAWPDRAVFDAAIRPLLANPKVVALGEMGLDRHYPEPPMEDQRRVFQWQLELAAQTTKAIIIHNREATDLALPMIRDSGIAPARFVVHCFTGSDAELDAILELGLMVSFTGIVTFKTSTRLLDATLRVPMDRIMVETDSPYLTPAPFRKIKVNEPGYVPYVAKALAARRNMSEADFINQADANADRFFGLSK